MKTIFLIMIIWASTASAWDGIDFKTGNHYHFDRMQYLKKGNQQKVWDSKNGEYRYITMVDVLSYGEHFDVDVMLDPTSNAITTLEMQQ